jgi:hypothetical protein
VEPSINPAHPSILALRQSLTQIRAHISTLEAAINANISSQLLALNGSSEAPARDNSSLPDFKAEKKNAESVGAVLGTVKVACAVERGLEALLGALELGKEEADGEGGLMEACMADSERVALEMQNAIAGMSKVLKVKQEAS